MSNKILVLGATGNIGSFLVQELRRLNADFIAGVPQRDMAKVNNIGVEGAVADFSDTASLDAAMERIDTLFLLLPMAPQMVQWATAAVASALKQHVSFILRSSLMDAAPDSPYSLFKVHGTIDKIVRDSGIPCAIVHPNSFMQNFVVYYAGSIDSTGSFSFTYDTPVSYIDVRDIAAVDARILADPQKHRGAGYTITGPEGVTNSCIARIISEAAGREIRFDQISEDAYRERMQAMGASGFALDAYMSLQRHAKDGKQERVTGDVRSITGQGPLSFSQFARNYARTWEKVPAKV